MPIITVLGYIGPPQILNVVMNSTSGVV